MLWLSAEFESQYGDAQIEIDIPLLVHSHALVDQYKEEFFGKGVAASIGT